MGLLPDDPKRWGAVTILKESARLLHRHGHLFLPFYLAFCIPLSIVAVFQSAFLGPSTKPHHYFVKSHFTQAGSDTSEQLLASLVCVLLVRALSTLATAAFTYTVAHIYAEDDTDDRSIVRKILKRLPHAFLRIFITSLWIIFTIALLYVASLIAGAVLYLIVSSLSGSSANLFLVGILVMLPFLSCVISVSIMFAFGQVVAVLEPESYGREALKKSMNLVRAGGAGTLLGIIGVNIVAAGVLLSVPTQAIAEGTLPLWGAIVLGVAIVALESVISVYFGVVVIVTYFVYKSRSDAASLSIPEFNGAATGAADFHKPLVAGSGYF